MYVTLLPLAINNQIASWAWLALCLPKMFKKKPVFYTFQRGLKTFVTFLGKIHKDNNLFAARKKHVTDN